MARDGSYAVRPKGDSVQLTASASHGVTSQQFLTDLGVYGECCSELTLAASIVADSATRLAQKMMSVAPEERMS